MPWARLDDRFHENRKIKRAWRRAPASIGLHVMAITYCAGYCTDGLVDVDFVEDKMPKDREREAALAALVDAGLWVPVEGGWHIHDFLEFNRSAEQIAALKQSKSEAGKKGADARWGDGTPDDKPLAPPMADAMAGATDVASTAHGSPMARPVPEGKPLEVGSPTDAGDEARVSDNGTLISEREGEVGLAEEIKGILQRGVDGLTTSERVRAPTREAVLKVHLQHHPPRDVALATAITVRSITQSQGRAPNVVGLYAQRLEQAMGATA